MIIILDIQLIRYWLVWKTGELMRHPKYQWHWYKSAYLVRRNDLCTSYKA